MSGNEFHAGPHDAGPRTHAGAVFPDFFFRPKRVQSAVFRDLGKKYRLREDLINMIREQLMLLYALDERAHSTIYAALQRVWVQKTETILHRRNSSAHEFPLLFPNRSVLNRLCTALELTLR